LSRGGSVIVAVVDTGADFRHPDLRPNLLAVPGSNLLRTPSRPVRSADDLGLPGPDALFGHGR
jgi:hypothetical protein